MAEIVLQVGDYTQAKSVKVSCAGSGNNTIVAAVTGKTIRVTSYTLVADTAVAVKFQDGAGGTDLTGAMKIGTTTDSGGVASAYHPHGHFATSSATLLNLNLSGAVQVSGHITYIEV